MILSLLAWFAWGPVDRLVEAGNAGGGWRLLDLGLSVLVLTGLETVLFGLIPLHLLDGAKLRAWSRRLWWGVFVPTAFAFGYLTIAETEKVAWPEVVRMAALFLGFGVLSLVVWAYARHRLEATHPAAGDAAGSRT